jgi:hypothetical protein
VTGLLPITGVTLPLVSVGGSSLVSTLLALGILVAIARGDRGVGHPASARRPPVTRTILVAGGGTAGHVFPALAVARELTALAGDVEVVFVGVEDRLEARLVPEAGFELQTIDAARSRGDPRRRCCGCPGRCGPGCGSAVS